MGLIFIFDFFLSNKRGKLVVLNQLSYIATYMYMYLLLFPNP